MCRETTQVSAIPSDPGKYSLNLELRSADGSLPLLAMEWRILRVSFAEVTRTSHAAESSRATRLPQP
jgi:hypothetical protein